MFSLFSFLFAKFSRESRPRYPLMEGGECFVAAFHVDVTSKIFALFDEPSDIIRASSVSRTWHHFVIANSICKKACLKKIPQFAYAAYGIGGLITELSAIYENGVGDGWEILEKEHKIFSSLLQHFSKLKASPDFMIAFPMGASSTDQDPPVTIINTLNLADCSYWSSKGESDPNASECLLYRVNSSISIVDEICIQALEAVWEPGNPVYSPIAVRFHMGHPKSIADAGVDLCMIREPCLDKYVWTYTSPQIPMAQSSGMQVFKMPEPVCAGGVVQIELIGRAQKDDKDGLFYIRLCHVKFNGRNLEPDFSAEMYSSGALQLTYNCRSPKHCVTKPKKDMGPVVCETCEGMCEGMFDFLDDEEDD